MAESQEHGFIFQKNIINENISDALNNIKISYTSEWDIPPVSVKSYNIDGMTIEFGSIRRIFEIDIDFIMILVGYEQVGEMKIVKASDSLFIGKSVMDSLKGMLTINELEELHKTLTSYGEGRHEQARLWAKDIKKSLINKTTFDVRFKIDSKKQRRIQCALNVENLYKTLGLEFIQKNKLNIKDILSPARQRNTS